MLVLLAFIIVFHITSAALLFVATIDNVSFIFLLTIPKPWILEVMARLRVPRVVVI